MNGFVILNRIREKGEGLSGTCIKDTWTKPKGTGSRVGSGDGWGGWESWGERETTVLEQQ